jgi:Secretion system C-terminal sorting domain
MNKHTIFSICLFASTHPGGAQEIDWINGYSGSYGAGFLLAPDGQGNLYGATAYGNTIVLGADTFHSNGGNVILVKWDSSGAVAWAIDLGGECPQGDLDNVEDLAYDPLTNEIVLVGIYTATMIVGSDTLGGACQGQFPDTYLYLLRIDSDGDVIWGAHATGGYVAPERLAIDASSHVHLVGSAPYGAVFKGQPDITVGNGGFHATYSAQGELLSAQRVAINGGPSALIPVQGTEMILSALFPASGSLLAQPIEVPQGEIHSCIARVDILGDLQWLYQLKSSGIVYIRDCIRTRPDRLVALGFFQTDLILPSDTIDSTPDALNAFLLSLDTNGAYQWLTLLHSPQTIGAGYNLSTDEQSHVYLYSHYSEEVDIDGVVLNCNTSQQGFIARFDTAGVLQSAWDFGKVRAGFGSVVPGADGIYVSCAYDSVLTFEDYVLPHPGGPTSYAMVAKLDSLGGFTGVQPFRIAEQQPLHIYANPNNGLCTIDLPTTLRATDDLVLSIYDNTGQLVQRAPLRFTEQGLKLDIRAQAKGIYHVELGDGQQRYTGTIVFE